MGRLAGAAPRSYCGASEVIGVAFQEREIAFVNGLSDARRRGSGLREGAEREQRKKSKKQENAVETCGLGSHSFGHLGSHFGPVKTAWRVNGSYKKCQVVPRDRYPVRNGEIGRCELAAHPY